MSDRPLPTPDEVSAEFWAATGQNRFLLQHDPQAQRSQFFPRPVSVFSEAVLEWRPAAGTGTLVAVTTARIPVPGFVPPYQAGIVRLDEGPRVFAPVVNATADIAPGRRMRLVWQGENAPRLYAFEPAE